MATNIVETIQKNLGYPVLRKIDPNIQDTNDSKTETITGQEKLAQAAIPSVLTALFKFTRETNGQEMVVSSSPQDSWLDVIYNNKEDEAVDKVAQYAGVPSEDARRNMESIATEAVRVLKESAGENATPAQIKTTMNDQRHNILVYLPAAMKLGDLLNDEALDDRTNKMEGPISNLMHAIEDKFSGGNDKPKYP